MDQIIELSARLSGIVLPVFVFLTMFNVGLTQTLAEISQYYRNWGFFLRMLVVNFAIAPLLMWGMLRLFPLDPLLAQGLLIFPFAAGAPFLIKLTQMSDNAVALGAALMLMLIAGTVLAVPLLMGLFLPEAQFDSGQIAWSLVRQLVLPIAAGMALVAILPDLADRIQPWVAKIGNIALYLTIGSTILGNLREVMGMFGEGAMLMGLAFILAMFGIGYLAGKFSDRDDLEDVGALGSGQRNTAATMIIAVQNFGDTPEVLAIITMVNTLGIILLLALARVLSRDAPGFTTTPGRPRPRR